ncbi:MAG: hypothetical protein BWY35_02220 [Firmicutes bacterium ADurb.Bin248]|nr:MAG: hypothetical protein BWY35_02220 [Firmicutes bacterium ADurb.Bin248]
MGVFEKTSLLVPALGLSSNQPFSAIALSMGASMTWVYISGAYFLTSIPLKSLPSSTPRPVAARKMKNGSASATAATGSRSGRMLKRISATAAKAVPVTGETYSSARYLLRQASQQAIWTGSTVPARGSREMPSIVARLRLGSAWATSVSAYHFFLPGSPRHSRHASPANSPSMPSGTLERMTSRSARTRSALSLVAQSTVQERQLSMLCMAQYSLP